MLIERPTGTVSLPNGLSIAPALTQDALRASPDFGNARAQAYGTLPWMHYHLPGGQVDGKELLVSLCFYDQVLVDVRITADLYPPGPKDWSNYSLDVEAATKHFHGRLLEQMFGEPTGSGSIMPGRLPKGQETLERPARWQFPWGRVTSYHDSKGGGTFITVSFGNRKEDANQAFRRRSGSA